MGGSRILLNHRHMAPDSLVSQRKTMTPLADMSVTACKLLYINLQIPLPSNIKQSFNYFLSL